MPTSQEIFYLKEAKGGKSVIYFTLKVTKGTGEAAWLFRALAALPEDPGSIPGTHMAAHNCKLECGSPVPQDPTLSHTYIKVKHTNAHKNINN